LENTPPPLGEYQPMSFEGKKFRRRKEQGGKCKRKREKKKRKWDVKRKNKCKIGKN
jgi:hypothetical protein